MRADRPEHTTRQALALGLAAAITLPGLVVRLGGAHPPPALAAAVFGLAVVGAAFLLAWAGEVVQLDISAGLALALLALVAVLPEYAVDFVFTWRAGHDPHQYAPLALANMTGGNQLLIGVGWSLVVMLAAWRIRRLAPTDRRARELLETTGTSVALERSHAVEVGFLLVATLYGLTLPIHRTLGLFDAVVLVSLFVAYMLRISRAPAEEPHLVGPAELVGRLDTRRRRRVVVAMFAAAAGVILACAEPFADSLVHVGEDFGLSTFLLVKWLAPIASEAPELLVAGLFAWRLNTNSALGALVSSKVNQWTLLVGTLPIVFAISSQAAHGLPLDALQREELFLTAAQSAFAVAVLANRRISLFEASWLLGLFVAAFGLEAGLPEHARGIGRIVVGCTYLVLAAVTALHHRRHVRALLHDGFRTPYDELASEPVAA